MFRNNNYNTKTDNIIIVNCNSNNIIEVLSIKYIS